jgi:hypothetical protein
MDRVVGDLSDAELIAATACAGWRSADVAVHVRMGAEAILAGLASPTTAALDRAAVSYWRDWTLHTPARFGDVRSTWASETVELVVLTLDGLLEARRAARWDTDTYVRKGPGRAPLDGAERSRRARLADRYPALG